MTKQVEILKHNELSQCFWKWNIKTSEFKYGKNFETMLGLEFGQFAGTYDAFLECICLEDREKYIKCVGMSFKQSESFQIEFRVKWPNGEIHWIEQSGDILFDESHQPLRVIGMMRNIDPIIELKNQNKILTSQIINTPTLLDSLLQGINEHALVSITDSDGVITYVNENFCKVSLYSPTELIGQNHNIISSKLHDSKFWKDFWKKLKTGQLFKGMVVNKNKEGELYYVDTVVVPIFSKTNKIEQFISIRTNITSLKKYSTEIEIYSATLEERFNEKTRELIETQSQLIQSGKLAALGEMSSGLAHELNNPLFLIQGFAENLKDKIQTHSECKDYEEMVDDVKEIYDNCLRMSSLINYFREFTRMSNQVSFEKVDLHTCINRAFRLFKEQFRLKEIDVVFDLGATHFKILGITNRMEQVFVNLFSNSRDALASKVIDKKMISIKTINDGENIKIIFRDNGSGIDKAIIDKIANPFFTTKETNFGTGLGLSITHTIVDEVNGKMTWDSVKNEYTEFEIIIPFVNALE
jgi:PAS domain S-box-containing protein